MGEPIINPWILYFADMADNIIISLLFLLLIDLCIIGYSVYKYLEEKNEYKKKINRLKLDNASITSELDDISYTLRILCEDLKEYFNEYFAFIKRSKDKSNVIREEGNTQYVSTVAGHSVEVKITDQEESMWSYYTENVIVNKVENLFETNNKLNKTIDKINNRDQEKSKIESDVIEFYKKMIRRFSISFLVILALIIFIPSTNTVYKMVAANYITSDNIKQIQDNSIDYIERLAKAINSARDVVDK